MIRDYKGVPVKFLRHDLLQIAEIADMVQHIPDARVLLIHKMISTCLHPQIPEWYKQELNQYIQLEFEALQDDKINYEVMMRQIQDLGVGELEEKSDDYYLEMLERYEDAI